MITKEMFQNLKNLKQLFLQANQIESVDVNVFKDLRLLEVLMLSMRSIDILCCFKAEIFTGDNKIKEIDIESYKHMKNLRRFIFHSNQIETIVNMTFGELPLLEELPLRKKAPITSQFNF